MNNITIGNHIVVLKNQVVLATTEIEPTPEGVTLRLAGTETYVKIDDISVIYETGTINNFGIDPAILSTLATLETGIREFEKQGGRPTDYTICGGSALALTIIPNRTTEDIDIIAKEGLEDFLAQKNPHLDYNLEFLNETALLMGDWTSRACTAIGPTGLNFRLMHPLDTIMQKLLRWSGEDFATKDWPDITSIIAILHPTDETLVKILTENPFRFTTGNGPISQITEAIAANTREFIKAFLPDVSYEKLTQIAYANHQKKLSRANILPLPNVDLRTKIKPITLGME